MPVERIERSILLIRAHRVMLDADLARLYGVSTKRLNEQVKRNRDRFPPDFMFQLTQEEKQKVVANCDHLRNLKFSKSLPYAFTEHGAVMLASVLSSSAYFRFSFFSFIFAFCTSFTFFTSLWIPMKVFPFARSLMTSSGEWP